MRLEISRRADLAVRAMMVIGSSDDRVKSQALAHVLETTIGMVPQIVGPLVKAGWVHSIPGPQGGYECRTRIAEINVLQVIELVDGATDTGRCVVADRPCDAIEPCSLHNAWTRARAELVRSLADTTLASLSGR